MRGPMHKQKEGVWSFLFFGCHQIVAQRTGVLKCMTKLWRGKHVQSWATPSMVTTTGRFRTLMSAICPMRKGFFAAPCEQE